MTDYAERIAAAAGDPAALLKLAIELAAAHASVEGRLAELQRADADRKRGAADRQARRRRGDTRDVTQHHATSRDITRHDDTSRDVTGAPPGSSSPTPPITPTPHTHTHAHEATPYLPTTAAGKAALDHCWRQMGTLNFDVLERYLAAIGARDVDGWWKEFARIIGPGTGVGGVDLAQALEDALLSTPIPNRPGPLRTFVASAMAERKRAAAVADGIDTRTPRSGARKPSREETEASRAFAQIMLLIQTSQTVANGTQKFIPRASVEALGTRVLAAYDEAGGASRWLTDDGAKIGLARRDFTQAYIGWTDTTNPQDERKEA